MFETILKVAMVVISVALVILCLLQSGKSADPGALFSGSTTDLFKNRKERGSELVISRTTLTLGILYVVICTIISFI